MGFEKNCEALKTDSLSSDRKDSGRIFDLLSDYSASVWGLSDSRERPALDE